MPNEFPVEPYEAILDALRQQNYPVVEAWGEFASAWNALSWRYLAVVEQDEGFRRSVENDGSSPEPLGRFRQEHHLFTFFVAGHSALEAFGYGTWAMLWATGDDEFELSTSSKRKRVTLDALRKRLAGRDPAAPLAVALDGLLESSDYKDWAALRNTLTHRGSPPRLHRAHTGGPPPPRPTDWGELPLDAQTTAVRREWLAEILRRLLLAAGMLAQEHFQPDDSAGAE